MKGIKFIPPTIILLIQKMVIENNKFYLQKFFQKKKPPFSSSKLSFVYFSIATLCTDFANMTISSLVKSLDAIINSTLPSVHVNE
jgi:hypothetical protein